MLCQTVEITRFHGKMAMLNGNITMKNARASAATPWNKWPQSTPAVQLKSISQDFTTWVNHDETPSRISRDVICFSFWPIELTLSESSHHDNML